MVVKNFLIILLIIAPVSIKAIDLFSFENVEQQLRFKKIIKQLRCITCKNQSLFDSTAPLAINLKLKIYIMLQAGDTDDNIINSLTNKYGYFITYKPPVNSYTMPLWIGPFVFLLIGLLAWLLILKFSSKS